MNTFANAAAVPQTHVESARFTPSNAKVLEGWGGKSYTPLNDGVLDNNRSEVATEGTANRVERLPQPSPDTAASYLVDLMAAVANDRDKSAFLKLFDHYAPRVKSFLIGLKANESVAEDLTQEVLYTVWSKASLFQSQKGSVNAWVFTIARNRFVDQIRRTRKPAIDPEEYALLSEAPVEADDLIQRQQNVERLRESLKELPAEQEAVVRMCFLEGKTQREIAKELDIPLGTVKSRSRLAFSRLRAVLGEVM